MTTPENQRQEAEKLIARMSREYPYWDDRKTYLDWLWGQVPDLLTYLRSLQSAHDTLLREHGEMRIGVADIKWLQENGVTARIVESCDRLLSSIPKR